MTRLAARSARAADKIPSFPAETGNFTDFPRTTAVWPRKR
jgi:hypothetical protein